MAEKKAIDEVHHIAKRRGNGLRRRGVWTDAQGRVTRYNLAYINHELFERDNGRVVGYDNRHGYHHRHWWGEVTAVEFVSFEETEARFEADWLKARSSP